MEIRGDVLPVALVDFEGMVDLEKRETLCLIQQMRILHNLICVSLLFIYLFTFSTQKTIISLLELLLNLYGSRVRHSTGYFDLKMGSHGAHCRTKP